MGVGTARPRTGSAPSPRLPAARASRSNARASAPLRAGPAVATPGVSCPTQPTGQPRAGLCPGTIGRGRKRRAGTGRVGPGGGVIVAHRAAGATTRGVRNSSRRSRPSMTPHSMPRATAAPHASAGGTGRSPGGGRARQPPRRWSRPCPQLRPPRRTRRPWRWARRTRRGSVGSRGDVVPFRAGEDRAAGEVA